MHIDASYSHIRESMRLGALYKGKETQDGEIAAAQSATASGASGDTVTISEMARRLQEIDASAVHISQTVENSLGKGNLRAEGLSGESKTVQDTGNEHLASLQRQVAAAEEQLQEATRKLQEAEVKKEQPSPETAIEEAAVEEAATADEGAEAGTGGSGEGGEAQGGGAEEVDTARLAVTEANNRLVQLKQEIAKAMKERLGLQPGGGGCITGTRCGTVGAPPPSKSHIGEAQDPYAAAQAYAAENGG